MFPLPHGMPRIIPLELGFSHSSIIYCRVHGAADGVVESWRLFVCVPMKQGLLRHYFPKEAVSRCWVVYSHEPFGALIFHLLSCIHIGDIFIRMSITRGLAYHREFSFYIKLSLFILFGKRTKTNSVYTPIR